MSTKRKLSAIMFTDIVGYTALMGQDESKAFDFLYRNRKLHLPLIDKYQGQFIKELGDGILAIFDTASEAVYAAKEIMENCIESEKFQLRIGIHLGEILLENNDVFGDGVNIAARIQSFAQPGSIYVSESIKNNISNKKDLETQYKDTANLKNVADPIKVYQVVTNTIRTQDTEITVNGNSEENSIAVLPFINMSSDAEQEYFCDGITEEMINTLTKLDRLRVISRTSAFSFKGKNIDVREIGDTLKVNTLLEGSVRKAANRVRITTTLINVVDGAHLWSNRYDRELEDIFGIQEDIATNVATELKGYLTKKEKKAVKQKETDVKAYDYFLKGKKSYHDYKIDDALKMFKKGIEIDPSYTPLYSGLADSYSLSYQWYGGGKMHLAEAEKYAIKALKDAPNIAESHTSYAFVLRQLKKNEQSEKEYLKAIKLNPNYFDAFYLYARFLFSTGRIKESITYFRKAADVRKEDFQSLILMVQSIERTGKVVKPELILETKNRLFKYLEINDKDSRALSLSTGFVYRYIDKAEAKRMIEKAIELYPNDLTVIFNGACYYSLIKDYEKALELLELAIGKGFGHKEWIENDSDYDPLREDPRFKKLMEKIS